MLISLFLNWKVSIRLNKIYIWKYSDNDEFLQL